MTQPEMSMSKPTLGTMDPFEPDTDICLAYSERLEQFFKENDITDRPCY